MRIIYIGLIIIVVCAIYLLIQVPENHKQIVQAIGNDKVDTLVINMPNYQMFVLPDSNKVVFSVGQYKGKDIIYYEYFPSKRDMYDYIDKKTYKSCSINEYRYTYQYLIDQGYIVFNYSIEDSLGLINYISEDTTYLLNTFNNSIKGNKYITLYN